MSKLSKYTLAFALSLAANAMLATSSVSVAPETNNEARLSADGAFRDGLYLGKRAAQQGEPLRPAIGRWSTPQDRSTFTAGYDRGYSEALAGIEP
ncbi:MAG: hypothetical protein ABR874_04470 [Candidatus Sulfotelmatobacter sp.]|jgi:hypothetical protein